MLPCVSLPLHSTRLFLCLKLPVAVPSLVINLLAVSFPATPKSAAAAESLLGCAERNSSALSRKSQEEGEFSRCSFPGGAVYALASELADLRNDIQDCDGSIGR